MLAFSSSVINILIKLWLPLTKYYTHGLPPMIIQLHELYPKYFLCAVVYWKAWPIVYNLELAQVGSRIILHNTGTGSARKRALSLGGRGGGDRGVAG